MREPIMNGGPNPAPLNRRLARSMMTGNQQHDPIAAGDGLLECAVDRDPAPSRFMPCRSSTRSGSTEPLRSFRSQVPSRVLAPIGTGFGETDVCGLEIGLAGLRSPAALRGFSMFGGVGVS